MRNHISIEHTPEHETKVEFQYPIPNIPPDVQHEIDLYVNKVVRQKLIETIRRLVLILEGELRPRTVLQALLVSVGIVPTDTNGSDSDVAKYIGVSRQSLYYYTKTLGLRLKKKGIYSRRKQ